MKIFKSITIKDGCGNEETYEQAPFIQAEMDEWLAAEDFVRKQFHPFIMDCVYMKGVLDTRKRILTAINNGIDSDEQISNVINELEKWE